MSVSLQRRTDMCASTTRELTSQEQARRVVSRLADWTDNISGRTHLPSLVRMGDPVQWRWRNNRIFRRGLGQALLTAGQFPKMARDWVPTSPPTPVYAGVRVGRHRAAAWSDRA